MADEAQQHRIAQKNYDRLSRWYDRLTGHTEDAVRGLGVTLLGVLPDERVLEVGCGTGKGLTLLADRCVHVHGIDVSVGMIHIARRRVCDAALSERVTIIGGDALHLPYRSGWLDAIYMCFTLELFTTADMLRVLAECRRVLRKGGRIGVVAMALPERLNLMTRLYLAAHQLLPRTVDCCPINLTSTLTSAGFDVFTVKTRRIWGLTVHAAVAEK